MIVTRDDKVKNPFTDKPVHTMLVVTELTTEDMLEIFIKLAKDLTWKLDKAKEETSSWKSTFEMYRKAWIREAGGRDHRFIYKHHEIDELVLTTKYLYENAMKWKSYENRLLTKDPFWMVDEFKEEVKDGI